MKFVTYAAAIVLLSNAAAFAQAQAPASGSNPAPGARSVQSAPKLLHHRQALGAMRSQRSDSAKLSSRDQDARENAETEQLNQGQIAGNSSSTASPASSSLDSGMGAPGDGAQPQAAQAPGAR